jgi:hypothetical protein
VESKDTKNVQNAQNAQKNDLKLYRVKAVSHHFLKKYVLVKAVFFEICKQASNTFIIFVLLRCLLRNIYPLSFPFTVDTPELGIY